MNLKKENIKKNIFLAMQIIFTIVTLINAVLVIMKKLDNAGYCIIPMLITLIFAGLYRNSKKNIDENK